MKRSLNEHIERIKQVANYNGKRVVNEDVQATTAPQGQPAPTAQGQPAPQQQQGEIPADFEKEITAALGSVIQDLPNELTQMAKTTGDRDGQIEVVGDQPSALPPQQPQQPVQTQPIRESAELSESLNEAIGMLAAGTALAAPAIAKMVGSAANFLGKKLDSTKLQSFGASAKAMGDKLHHTYEHAIDAALSPVTKNLTPDRRKLVNKLVFNAIIATFFGVGAAGAFGAAGAGQAGLAAAEGGLSSVKAAELIQAAKEIIPQVLASTGAIA